MKNIVFENLIIPKETASRVFLDVVDTGLPCEILSSGRVYHNLVIQK